MSLYDGLDIEEKGGGGGGRDKKPDVSGWGSSLKLMETTKQLHAKKASLINLRKRQTTMAPVIDLKKRNDEGSSLTFDFQTGRLVPVAGPPAASPFIAGDAPSSLTGVMDEYDPLRPNDYEEFSKKRKREKDREKRQEEEERRKRRPVGRDDSDEEGSEFDRRRKQRERHEEEEFERNTERPRRSGGAAIAPPQSLLEDQGPPQQQQQQQPPPAASEGEEPGPGPIGAFKPMGIDPGYGLRDRSSVASKIMAKMGYREGSGLGKSEQGMSTALLVEKTSKRGGKIIHERDLPKGSPVPPEMIRVEVSNANILKNPSKVLLLRNMVGPGEVDAELEPETAEECSKYGKVAKCVIFEMPNTTEDEAVRIFVEFEKQDSAIKAVVDLNGRFFGGRVVKGSFYNLDKFRHLDLAGPTES